MKRLLIVSLIVLCFGANMYAFDTYENEFDLNEYLGLEDESSNSLSHDDDGDDDSDDRTDLYVEPVQARVALHDEYDDITEILRRAGYDVGDDQLDDVSDLKDITRVNDLPRPVATSEQHDYRTNVFASSSEIANNIDQEFSDGNFGQELAYV